MSYWKNKKHGSKKFKSSHERDKDGERIFVLKEVVTTKKSLKKYSFESFQMAKKLGWSKC